MTAVHSLSKWPIFSLLPDSFLWSIKLACVFGSAGNEAIVITQSDEVYALGSNSSSCLGIGDMKGSLGHHEVVELSKKGNLDSRDPSSLGEWHCPQTTPT